MAKKPAAEVAAPLQSWDDFSEENLLKEPEVSTPDDEEEEEEGEETPKPELKKPAKVEKKATPIKKEESVLEEEEEEEEVKIPDATLENKEPETNDSVKFFEEVHKITGEELDVEYGEVDPLSPQGIAMREKVVKQAALDGFLEEIETNFPTAYKALQHAYNGGNIADLFKSITSRDYSKVVLSEDNPTIAKEVLKEYYQSKGIKNPTRIDKLIELAEDSEEGLLGEADSALKELQAEQAEKEVNILNEQKAKDDNRKKQDTILVSALDEVLESGKLDSFKLAGPKETAEFRKFVMANLRRSTKEEGKYEFATQIDGKNLEKLLKYKFFEFKNGDLSKLVQIKAITENTQKLRLRLEGEKAGNKTTAQSSPRTDGLSLQDF